APGGSAVTVHPNSVVYIGHREVHAIYNTGREKLRVLVSTPLIVRSERALRIAGHRIGASPAMQPPETPDSREPERVEPAAPAPELERVEGQGESRQAEEEGAASNVMELQVVFDGGSRGNPGQGYGSFMVQSPNRKPVVKRLEFGDNYTNNQAEYESMIEALK